MHGIVITDISEPGLDSLICAALAGEACARPTQAKYGNGRSDANREIDLLCEYRARLIADVVTGKLDVRDAANEYPGSQVPAADDEILVDHPDGAGTLAGSGVPDVA